MFSDPIKNIEQLGLTPGMEVADFGSGSGQYSMASSRAMAGSGKVYSIDINKDLLTKLKNSSVKEGIYNIEVIWGDLDKLNGTKLRDFSVDFVLVCNILFQLENKDIVVKEVKRILKPGGKVLVVDWEDSFGGIGPKPEVVFNKKSAEKLFEKEGFHLEKEIKAGSHHYGLVMKKL